MKTPKLEDYILWKGQPAKIVGLSDGPQATIEIQESERCRNCKSERIFFRQFQVIIASPLFQENAMPIQTLEES